MPRSDVDRTQSAFARVTRARSVRFTAATVAVGLTAAAVVSAGGGTAFAADQVNSQSVGRFVDGSTGGMPLEAIADLKDARAQAAPDSSSRNPLDLTLFKTADVPIGDGLKFPGGGAFAVGASNQIAVAKTDGYAYGAAGAIANSGGAQLTDDANAYPSDGSIVLSGTTLGSTSIPGLPAATPGLPPTLPGLPAGASNGVNAATLGGVVATLGAVQALAQTESGGKAVTPQSSIADVNLAIGSPALSTLLAQLNSAFSDNVTGALPGALSSLPSNPVTGALTGLALPAACTFTSDNDVSAFSKYGLSVDPEKATITIDVGKLVKHFLHKDISDLDTSNFDLVSFLAQNLPSILSSAIMQFADDVSGQLEADFSHCADAFGSVTGLPAGTTSAQFTAALDTVRGTLEDGINSIVTQLTDAGATGLVGLADQLENIVDIGLNVQSGPAHQPHDTQYPYTSQLAHTPDQSTSTIKGQTLVRAIEIDLLDAAGSGGTLPQPPSTTSLPSTSSIRTHQAPGSRAAKADAAGDSVVSLALANAAAGPGKVVASDTVHRSAPRVSSAAIPTGVPAGAAGHQDGGSPVLPITLLLLGLIVAGGGITGWRMRERHAR